MKWRNGESNNWRNWRKYGNLAASGNNEINSESRNMAAKALEIMAKKEKPSIEA